MGVRMTIWLLSHRWFVDGWAGNAGPEDDREMGH
jgi:hypothetical protein